MIKPHTIAAVLPSEHPDEAGRGAVGADRVLIADDQADVRTALRLLLKAEGYVPEVASSPAEVLAALGSSRFQLLMMDLNYARDTTSGQEGLDLLKRIQTLDGAPPVIVLTGWPTIDLAVESMRTGVTDFARKPWNNSELLAIVRTQIAKGWASRERREKAARAARELEEARRIQQSLVPRCLPSIPGIRIATDWRPADALSGDYFDVLRINEDEFAVCIADAAGKGMPAALLMSNLQATVRNLTERRPPPQELCERLNQLVSGSIADNRFITFFYALLDTRERILRYTNAGHNPPFLVRRDGSVIRLADGGGVFGVRTRWSYRQSAIELNSGDRVLLFTDGVSEAVSPMEEEFGENRLAEILVRWRHMDPEPLKREIMAAAEDFTGGSFQDDATLVVVAVD